MKFKPNGNWVILPNPAKKKTDSGIILDDKTVNQMKTNILMVDLDDKNYIMIPEHQILGVM